MMRPFQMPNAKPATRSQLERRANKHGLTIRKFKRGEELFLLVNLAINAVVGTFPLTLEEVEQRLDELDNGEEETAFVRHIDEPAEPLVIRHFNAPNETLYADNYNEYTE